MSNKDKSTKPEKPTKAQQLAAIIIDQLERNTAPWQKPWKGGATAFPYNPITGNRYKGVNAIALMSMGFSDPRFMTYKQAIAAGAQVRAGEKGTPIVFYQFTEKVDRLDDKGKPVFDENGKKTQDTILLERPKAFWSTVFNGSQIEGLPPLAVTQTKEQQWEAVDRAEKLLAASGAKISHSDSNRAFYRPATDSIHLPNKEQFPEAIGYYQTALHELTHWTGHGDRLGRDIGHPFGSKAYAREELVAEIGSVSICGDVGLDFMPREENIAYVQSWVEILKDKPTEIFKAAAAAEKARDMVVGKVLELELAQDKELRLDKRLAPALDAPGLREAQTAPELTASQKQYSHGVLVLDTYAGRREHPVEILDETVKQYKIKILDEGGYNLPGNRRVEQGDVVSVPKDAIKVDTEHQKITAQAEKRYLSVSYEEKDEASTEGFEKWLEPQAKQSEIIEALEYLEFRERGSELSGPEVKSFEATEKKVKLFSRVKETEDSVKLTWANQDKMVEALVLAKDKFAGEISVQGNRRFKQNTVKAAVKADLDIRFADSELETMRVQLMTEKQEREAQKTKNQKVPERSPENTQIGMPEGERTLINVPFKEKDEARGLGAKWDKQEKSWYVPAGVSLEQFTKWTNKDEQQQEILSQEPYQAEKQKSQEMPKEERQYLYVPYEERTLAKAAGALWDKEEKSWYKGPAAQHDKLARWEIKPDEQYQAPAMSPQEEFAEFLKSAGCHVDSQSIVMDGSKQRVAVGGDKPGDKSGFYVGHLDGRPAGYVMNNRTGAEAKWKYKGYSMTPEDKAQLQAVAAHNKAQQAAKMAKANEVTAERVKNTIETYYKPSLEAEKQTPYISNKGIVPTAGTFTQEKAGILCVPAMDVEGKIWTAQYISPDGKKSFATDGKKEGCFHPIGGELSTLGKGDVIIIAEGYATANSIFEATKQPVVATFDSGNLKKVAEALHEKYPDKPIIIAADDDKHLIENPLVKKNVGKGKAYEAANAVGGVVVLPKFAPGEQELCVKNYANYIEQLKTDESAQCPKILSDFNDVASSSLGKEAVKKQMGAVVARVKREQSQKQQKIQQTRQLHRQSEKKVHSR